VPTNRHLPSKNPRPKWRHRLPHRSFPCSRKTRRRGPRSGTRWSPLRNPDGLSGFANGRGRVHTRGMGRREISLSGGDTSVLKAIGMSGASIKGNLMIERLGNDLEIADLIDTLEGLLMFDYVQASTDRFRTIE